MLIDIMCDWAWENNILLTQIMWTNFYTKTVCKMFVILWVNMKYFSLRFWCIFVLLIFLPNLCTCVSKSQPLLNKYLHCCTFLLILKITICSACPFYINTGKQFYFYFCKPTLFNYSYVFVYSLGHLESPFSNPTLECK